MKRYRIPELAQKYMKHEMIASHMKEPIFPDTRIRLLSILLDKHPAVKRNSELYALVTSLVQMALDTHELIEPSDERKPEREMRVRQVNVLAGDFFSSRFYQLLAASGEVGMIQQLSTAVAEINRIKMDFYMRIKQLRLTTEEYVTTLIQLKTQLFTAFQSSMEEVPKLSWSPLFRAFTECEIVREEIERPLSAASFHGSWGFWHILNAGLDEDRELLRDEKLSDRQVTGLWSKYQIHSLLMDRLRAGVTTIQALMRDDLHDKTMKDIWSIAEPFVRLTHETVTVVKKG